MAITPERRAVIRTALDRLTREVAAEHPLLSPAEAGKLCRQRMQEWPDTDRADAEQVIIEDVLDQLRPKQ